MKRIFLLLAVLIIMQVVSTSVNATIITFDNKSHFLASTGSTSATGPLPNLSFVGNGYTIGSATFSAPSANGLWIGGDPDWTKILPGNEIAIDGPENIDVDLANPVSAFGFDFVEPITTPCESRIGCFESIFLVTLKNDTTTVGSFTFNAANDRAAFVGVWSDIPFKRVEILDLITTDDNEYFGEFYTRIATTPVPEPSTLLLFGSGMAGIAVIRKRLGWDMMGW